MIWTKRFKQDSEYQSYIDGEQGKVYKPNVSVCENEYHVHYNPGPIDRPDETDYGVIEIEDIESFGYEGGSETTSLTTRATNTWVITEKSGWLDISPMKGTGATTLSVECDEYEGFEDRKGFFTVRYTMPNTRYSTTKYGITQEHIPIDYLTFEILSAGTLNWKTSSSSSGRTIEYSKDNEQTWSAITSTLGGVSISVAAGDIVKFRGENITYSGSSFGSSTSKFNVYGNLLTLIDYKNVNNISGYTSNYAFVGFFEGCKGLINASNLVFPSFIYYGCYQQMFNGCKNLTTAPELPATTLTPSCYQQMFQGCTNLNYIKCLATNISATNCTNGWVSGVASSGRFIKDASMTGWTTGSSGIPSNWTVEDAT